MFLYYVSRTCKCCADAFNECHFELSVKFFDGSMNQAEYNDFYVYCIHSQNVFGIKKKYVLNKPCLWFEY